jgi:Fe-S cluster assembly protein SufD
LSGSRFQQSSDSSFEAHFITSAGALNRNDIITRLNGSGASCSLHGLTLVADGELGDFHVTVEHSKPHGSSRQMFKSILDGKSRAVFDGIIKVVKDAQKTDAAQSSRNLLLSKRAIANANPRLEILADDVSCSHGSTTGFLDPDALFYLRSRGLGERQAKALRVYGFAHEQIEAIRLQALRDRLEKLLLERFTPTA